MLMVIPSEVGISKFIKRFKRACAYNQNIQWQRGAFDHRIRCDDSYSEKKNIFY
jgi:hypothetical protein